MIKVNLVSLFLLVILFSCTKENSDSSANAIIYFSGITKRDIQGTLMTSPDTTDWRFDDKWTSKEENLFSLKNQVSNQECTASIIVYPNPFQELLIIQLSQIPSSSRLEIRLVNKDFKIIVASDSIVGSVMLKPPDISEYDTLRLYYKLIDSSNYEYRGHGDILIQK